MSDTTKGNDNVMGISEFARLVGCSVDTLRHWDNTGKLKTERTGYGDRIYRRSQMEQARDLMARRYWPRGRSKARQ